MTQTLTVVMSGGGIKAAAHIGAMRAIVESGLTPTRYIGTSMGAAIAAGFAAGLSVAEMSDRMRSIDRRDIAAVSPMSLAKGLYAEAILRPNRLRRTLERLLPVERFDQLRVPLLVTAVDLDNGDLVTFGGPGEATPMVDAVYASCALPLLYPPAEIAGRRFSDGGLRGVVPLEVARNFPSDLIVAIDVGPGFDVPQGRGSGPLPPPAVRIHNEAQWVMMAEISRLQLALWQASPQLPRLIYIRPPVGPGATFDTSQIDSYLEEGYLAAVKELRS